MRQKSLSQINMLNSSKIYHFDLEDILVENSPFFYLIESDKESYYFGKQFRNRKQKSKKQKYQKIDEATRLEILKAADSARKARAKKLTTKYMGVTQKNGWIQFQTHSQYTPGLKYIQTIKLKEAKDMKHFKEFKEKDIVRLFLNGDLQVKCTCNDFRYRYSYLTYQLGYGLTKENRFPKIVNPNLKGSVCKHLLCVLTVLNNNWLSIQKDMVKTKWFRSKL